MADYSKWKVVDLKAELKRRGIAQTGLRVKQQFIDRLVEEDEKGEPGGTVQEPAPESEAAPEVAAKEPEQPAEPEPEPEPQPQPDSVPEPEPESPTEQPAGEATQPTEVVSDKEEQPRESAPSGTQDEQAVEKQDDQAQPEPPSEAPEKPVESVKQADAGDQAPSPPSVSQPPPAQPVEQAPGDAAPQQPAPADTNGAGPDTATGKGAPSDANTELSTPLPTEEVLEDRRKRKRRSQSPVPTAEAIANKKAKAQENGSETASPRGEDSMDVDRDDKQEASEAPDARADDRDRPASTQDEAAPESPDARAKKGAPKQDVRFKGLFAAKEPQQPRPASPPADTAMDDEHVEPALHAATAALYVDGLMRPLQPTALRTHLASLASPPGSSPNPDVIVDFYLDPIKTHCFAAFTNVTAATRARAALHGTVWPPERNRKTLFVDFIPENKLHEWIDTEERSRGRGGPPARWEVKFDRTEDGVEAVLEEVDARTGGAPPGRGPEPGDFSRPPPTGPRADIEPGRRPSGPPAAEPTPRPGQGFQPLDELFMSTTAKPKLYYLPVPRRVADRRLDRFDDLLQKGSFPRRGGDELRRITFEDEDLFVDHGPEFAPRGGYRGGGRGGGRGRGRGRGGFGDSWRDEPRGRYY
ncbi:SAP domain protein [Aspergillus candidus]|uniref:SAP domain-containing protein n=1 Tax=Aspergillus candidus TaxID=41067 RepID=A0A2I2FDW6_ASPCN|nr:hypothetical protein BDW47DRAFT_104368 [Aspergillus candidus]PLB38826.1 hypothetical protein BDW47DRAFT_104368 [Aspergillus candidus]